MTLLLAARLFFLLTLLLLVALFSWLAISKE
jgi:hypothetical protein